MIKAIPLIELPPSICWFQPQLHSFRETIHLTLFLLRPSVMYVVIFDATCHRTHFNLRHYSIS